MLSKVPCKRDLFGASLGKNGVIHTNELHQTVRLRNFNFYENVDLNAIMKAAEIANSLMITGSPDSFYSIMD